METNHASLIAYWHFESVIMLMNLYDSSFTVFYSRYFLTLSI